MLNETFYDIIELELVVNLKFRLASNSKRIVLAWLFIRFF